MVSYANVALKTEKDKKERKDFGGEAFYITFIIISKLIDLRRIR